MVGFLSQRACVAAPCNISHVSRPIASLRTWRARAESSSSADSYPQPNAAGTPSLAQRLAAKVQRAAAAVLAPRQAASETLSRLLEGSNGTQQRLGSVLLLSAAAVGSVGGGASGVLADLTSNYVFCVGFCGWFLAQFLKIFTKRYKRGVWDARAFFESGGMPSSHSALCTSTTTAIAMQQGLGSPLFAIAVCFSVIVMYDAMGIRRHAGLQAELLNVVVGQVLEGHPMSERKLKEVLGHTPRQVYAGLVLGILVGLLFPTF
ncbi:hypothetical protein D9Q98_003558 [Chlorella vulgaris]|uniref:Uncharacterized protein n=1 Tax=Chlorella vulgaris TaxID=3077 RepID=A0A9D4TT48_CHLVU|nr:hypothetical protein D9Q98_003558 [Chlorella vulgaris]